MQAAKNTSELQQMLLDQQDLNKEKTLGEMLGDEAGRNAYLQVLDSFDTLQQKAEAYLQYKFENTKMDPKPKNMSELKGKNPYEQRHIDYAKGILKAVSDFRNDLSRPMSESEKEDYTANKQRRELDKRRSGEAAAEENPILQIP